jgi:hypothetical protein
MIGRIRRAGPDETEEQDMKQEEVAEVLAKPISPELLGSSIPARLAYVGVDGEPRVLLIRGAARVELVDGMPDTYVEASRKVIPAEDVGDWEQGTRALYDQMAEITIEPDRRAHRAPVHRDHRVRAPGGDQLEHVSIPTFGWAKE